MPHLRAGHDLVLLEGSRAFFPSLAQAIEAATDEVRLETYIFDFTGASEEVAYALERAARRGVAVMVLVDGVGCPEIPGVWQLRFQAVGVQWETYSPPGMFGLLVPGQWRRLHRKLCVVDGVVGFCGGINILDDYHDPNWGALESPRLDFAVRVTGPLVEQMHLTMTRQWRRQQMVSRLKHARLTGALASLRSAVAYPASAPATVQESARGGSKAALVLRDNVRNRARIEQAYRRAIGRAREEIIIANAYFVPGRKLRRALVQAARRGVKVILLLQGRYEYFLQYYAVRSVFGALLRAGVEIHEYSPSFLHCKVAVVDRNWATVGSSNLDPLSLLLAREANVVVEDSAFALQLRGRLVEAMRSDGVRMDATQYERRPPSQRFKEWLALVLMRIGLAIQGKKY
ncbi:MAG TPA: cardiolipin synthase ClsB [Ramlibacter sp.]|uniref:cardiolipin synthase ClsB n=1 Tax=Ramlibacter sp. TaxID=1917967 RepID=UPI002CA69D79|nr:cardiolipin synthase ClsB [Ramlibacter sp.]HVZ42446.1 cardiolipin synthase ClsB [Ramlibacter sp.]